MKAINIHFFLLLILVNTGCLFAADKDLANENNLLEYTIFADQSRPPIHVLAIKSTKHDGAMPSIPEFSNSTVDKLRLYRIIDLQAPGGNGPFFSLSLFGYTPLDKPYSLSLNDFSGLTGRHTRLKENHLVENSVSNAESHSGEVKNTSSPKPARLEVSVISNINKKNNPNLIITLQKMQAPNYAPAKLNNSISKTLNAKLVAEFQLPDVGEVKEFIKIYSYNNSGKPIQLTMDDFDNISGSYIPLGKEALIPTITQ